MSRSFFFYYFEWKKREKELVYNGNVTSFRCFKNVFFISVSKSMLSMVLILSKPEI